MENISSLVRNMIALYGLRVVAGIIILVVGRYASRLLSQLVRKLLERAKVEATLVGFVSSLVYVGLMAFVIIAALGKLGVQTASFVAVIGAAGLAVGLALQGSLSNFAAGVLILLFRPFKAGDVIDAAGVVGAVETIHIFTTSLKTADNRRVIVPNASITGGNITNITANATRRVDLVVGVGYGENLQKVKDVIADVLKADERVLKDPAPTIGVLELADSSVNLAVRPWVNTGDYWAVHFGLLETIKTRFDTEGISIPFPQRDLHIFQETKS
jgi:small conductance mechanosensitive channel